MTLPTSGAISLSDVLTELKVANPSRTAPISLGDADVLALAGKSAPPISISDLYGKSSYIPLSVTPHNATFTANSGAGAGSALCSPSVSVTGGSGGTTYLWSFTSNPSGCVLGNSTSAVCNVSHSYGFNASGTASATLQCIVSDNSPHSTTIGGITANLDWGP